jgi:hypothetical protein
LWKDVDEKTKEEYEEKARVDKERYLKQKAEYAASAGPSKSSKVFKVKKVKDENAPKRNASAYFLFASEMRPKLMAEDSTLTYFSVATKVGELWREMDEEKKKPYEDKAVEDKARYERELEEYKKSPEYEAHLRACKDGASKRGSGAGIKRKASYSSSKTSRHAGGKSKSGKSTWITLEEFSDDDDEDDDEVLALADAEDDPVLAIKDESDEGDDEAGAEDSAEEEEEEEADAGDAAADSVLALLDEEMEAEGSRALALTSSQPPRKKYRRIVDSDDE